MNTKEKAPEGANIFFKTQDKDTNFSILGKVLEIFKSGQKVTAVALNRTIGFNDSRKVISDLRAMHYPIEDYRLPDARKVYFLPPRWEEIMKGKLSNKQPNLFDYD